MEPERENRRATTATTTTDFFETIVKAAVSFVCFEIDESHFTEQAKRVFFDCKTDG
jgi:hypothetical protein